MNVPFLQTATFTGLISTDEYRTSQEWNEAYDISQNVFTNVQSNSGNWNTAYNSTTALQLSTDSWNSAYNIATFYSLNSAILIEQTTFSELTSQKANNQLKPGQLYQINDFQLMWWNHDSANTLKTTSLIEPLIVQAVTNNKIASEALSVLHPDDIVYYDIDATTSTTWKTGPSAIPGFKGWIYRRINLTKNIDIAWDWRYITNNCCKYDLTPVQLYSSGTTYSKNSLVKTTANKLYISVQNNNTGNSVTSTTWWRAVTPYTNDSVMYYPTNEDVVVSGTGPGLGVNYFEVVLGLLPDTTSRISLPTFAEHMNDPSILPTDLSLRPNINNIKIDSGYNNVFMTNTSSKSLYALTIGPGCRFNIITTTSSNGTGGSGGLYNCRIGGDSLGNLLTNNFTNHVIGDGFQFNIFNNANTSRLTISNLFQKNIVSGSIGGITQCNIGDSCSNNFFIGFSSCIIGQNYQNNVSSTGFTNNRFGNSCSNNFFYTNFSFNTLRDSCSNNNFGTSSSFNDIGSLFQNNTIGTNCTYNSFENGCTNNIIGTFMSYNKIGSTFTSNTIGNSFTNNTISNSFTNNTIGNSFRRVNAGNSITGTDFSGATFVYNDYDKNILTDASILVPTLFYSNNTVLITTLATS